MPVKKKQTTDGLVEVTLDELMEDRRTPPALIERAIESGASVEVMERLLVLQQRWEESQAKKAYASAIADLRPDLPEIIKNRSVDFTTDKGRTHYRYEDLQSVTEALSPPMAKHGLSFRWRTVSDGPDKVTVSCIISHRAGHSEENSLSARHDTSGNKNPIQALGSAVTYLQRYTLKAAVGVAAAADDDGQTATPEQQHRTDPEKIMAVSRRQPSAKPYRAVDDPKPLGEKQQELKDLIEKYVLDNNLEDTDKATIFKEVTMFKPKDPKKNPFPGYDKFDFSKLSDVHAASALRKFNEAVSGKK